MNDSIIQKVIGRSNRNLMIISILGIVLVIGLAGLNARYFYNFFLGPFDAKADELTTFTSASAPQKYWIKVTGEELVNTGIQYFTTSRSGSEKVEATYFAMILGERLMLVRIDGDQSADTLPPSQTGWLEEISSEENIKVVLDLETQEPSIKGAFLPFKMETGDFRTNGYIGIVVGLATLGLSLWGIATVIGRTIDPNSHPILKKLARFGPLEFVASRIDAEMAAPHNQVGKLNLTANWLVYADKAKFLATRYEDVAWVYKHVLTQRSYGIAVGKTYTAMVYDRFGEKMDFVAGRKEPAVNDMLQAICERAPWAVIGYTQDIQNAWNKDRSGFLAAVERRKTEAGSRPG